MGSEDFDQRIRKAFDRHEPEVKGDWKRMQAALIGAAGGTTAAVVRARWVGGAAGAAAVAAAVSGWMFWKTPTEEQSGKQTHSYVPQTAVVVPAEEVAKAELQDIEAHTLSKVEVPMPRDIEAVGESSEQMIEAGSADASETNAAEGTLISCSVKEACAGAEVRFSLEGDWAKGSILWNFGDGSFSNEVAPIHVFAKEGTYDITISTRSPNDGAIRTRTVEDMIVIRPRPEAQMAWRLKPVGESSSVLVALENLTEQATAVTWKQGDQMLDGPEVLLQGTGVYPVTLSTGNAFGCRDERTEMVRVGGRSGLDAPSTFSPDGDGKRDVFMPEGLKRGDFVLTIRDLEGTVVFQSRDYKHPWDGQLQSGMKAPEGALFRWTAVREVQEGKPEFFSDRVRIER